MASTAGRRRAAERERKDLGPFLSVEVEGVQYLLTARDLTGLDVQAMRQQLGFGYNGLVDRCVADMDVDLLAAIVWLARRIKGERDLTYPEVAGQLHYDVDWRVVKQPVLDQDAGGVVPGEHDPEA